MVNHVDAVTQPACAVCAALVFAVPARRLAASGPIVCMSVLSMPPHHYLLVVHEGSGAAVWDLRAQLIVAVLGHNSGDAIGSAANGGSSSRPAAITAAAWLPGSSKGDFATGHEDGAVCIWDMPPSAGSSASSSTSNGTGKQSKLAGDVLQPLQQQHSLQAQLVSQLQGSSSASSGGSPKKRAGKSNRAGPRYRPVKSLEFAAGAVECLAVFGGNEVDRPNGLTLLPLPEPTQVCLGACVPAYPCKELCSQQLPQLPVEGACLQAAKGPWQIPAGMQLLAAVLNVTGWVVWCWCIKLCCIFSLHCCRRLA